MEQCHRAEANPDTESIERTGIGIISFTDLERRLVQVKHDSDTCHEEQQECQPAAPLVALELEEQSENSQQQREKVIVVLALIVLQDIRSIALVSKTDFVDRLDTAFPIPIEYISRTRAVDIILPSGEIPHKIPPVHPVQLEVEEEIQVRPERRFLVVGPRYHPALSAGISLIESDIFLVAVPHPREEHLS